MQCRLHNSANLDGYLQGLHVLYSRYPAAALAAQHLAAVAAEQNLTQGAG